MVPEILGGSLKTLPRPLYSEKSPDRIGLKFSKVRKRVRYDQ